MTTPGAALFAITFAHTTLLFPASMPTPWAELPSAVVPSLPTPIQLPWIVLFEAPGCERCTPCQLPEITLRASPTPPPTVLLLDSMNTPALAEAGDVMSAVPAAFVPM